MGMNDLEIMIRSIRADVDSDVCSRSRVMDSLLDLRAKWWREQLDSFEMVAINPVETVG